VSLRPDLGVGRVLFDRVLYLLHLGLDLLTEEGLRLFGEALVPGRRANLLGEVPDRNSWRKTTSRGP
jgi:hypothetical protein